MKEVFANVSPATDPQGVLSDEASVGVINKRMEAYNKHLSVSQPCDLPNFNVPVSDFAFAMRKVENPKLKVTDANVTLTGGGTTRVRRLGDRTALKKPDIATTPIADIDDLLNAIDDVFPFTEGDPARPWSEGARFDGNLITATNSVMLCQAELVSSSGFNGVTVSRAALAYIRQRRADLKAWGASERGILLEFADGGWALATRMTMEMPDSALNIIKMVNDWEDFQVVDDSYRGAFMRAADWASELLSVFPDRLLAGRLSSEHDEPVDTNLGDHAGPALFASKSLVTVVSTASQIAFDRYPHPVPFVTKRGSKGLIAGRTS